MSWLPRLSEGPVAWLRRLLCRCPDTVNTDATATSGTHLGLHWDTFDVPPGLEAFVEPAAGSQITPSRERGGHLRLVPPPRDSGKPSSHP